MQLDTTLLANNSQHCQILHVASLCLPCCMLLIVVASVCTPLPTCTPQLPKLLVQQPSVCTELNVSCLSLLYGYHRTPRYHGVILNGLSFAISFLCLKHIVFQEIALKMYLYNFQCYH